MPRNRAPERPEPIVDLRLFIAGFGERSLRTIDNVKRACEKYLPGRYRLAIIDIYLRPEAAIHDQIVAVPTLIQQAPTPVRMFVGEIHAHSELDRQLSCISAMG